MRGNEGGRKEAEEEEDDADVDEEQKRRKKRKEIKINGASESNYHRKPDKNGFTFSHTKRRRGSVSLITPPIFPRTR